MNPFTRFALLATLLASGLASGTAADDSLAYHQVQQPALHLTAASASTSVGMATSIPLVDPMPAETIPATASILSKPPTGNSFLEATTAMIGTVGMLILVFRRRVDSAA